MAVWSHAETDQESDGAGEFLGCAGPVAMMGKPQMTKDFCLTSPLELIHRDAPRHKWVPPHIP